jgi:hypothetical protein
MLCLWARLPLDLVAVVLRTETRRGVPSPDTGRNKRKRFRFAGPSNTQLSLSSPETETTNVTQEEGGLKSKPKVKTEPISKTASSGATSLTLVMDVLDSDDEFELQVTTAKKLSMTLLARGDGVDPMDELDSEDA